MQKRFANVIFSPSDLNVFFESDFASWMDRYHLECPEAVKPCAPPEEKKLASQMGIAHEQRYLASLKSAGYDVFEAPDRSELETTLEAMRAGRAVIYQGKLGRGHFEGYADFLYRVETPSALGSWSYEVADTKLARKPKPYFLLQLCGYAKMLEHMQGLRPENVHVVDGEGHQASYRTDDYFFYFLALEREFLGRLRGFNPERRPTPAPRADHGRWTSLADKLLEEADHLCRVAGITSHQMKRLGEAGVTTLIGLATCTLTKVPKLDQPIFERLRAQARLQRGSAGRDTPLHEIIEPDRGASRYGLALLPPESPLDVYFDLEGYPFADGGLEYLFGATHLAQGEPFYWHMWAHDRAGEKRAFEAFVDWIYSSWRRDPSMHVYHYGSYEVTALRRLMGQHGTREEEIDALLTAEAFVDLLRVVKQSVRIGEPGYSLKNVEHLYRQARSGGLASATQSVVEYARWLETRDGEARESSRILEGIRSYNRDDCESTWGLRRWLAARQAEAGVAYAPPRTKPDKTEKPDPVRDAAEALAQRLLEGIPVDRSADPERWRIQELLAWLVGFHRREAKPIWWALFDRQKMTDEELMEDSVCLGALVRTQTPAVLQKQSLLYEYRFDPNQDTKLAAGSRCFIAGDDLTATSIAKLDAEAGLVQIKLGKKRSEPPRVISLIPSEHVSAEAVAAAIAGIADDWERSGTLPEALDTVLRRSSPRIDGLNAGAPILGGVEADELSVTSVIARLVESAIAIQGPPGAGKTQVAAAAILELARGGNRIGISSNSHKAIQKLIEEVQKRERDAGTALRITKVNSDDEDELITKGAVTGAERMRDVVFDGPGAPHIVGGTAWAFSDPNAIGRFDYLFVDEAGQVSLANLVGMSPCARNLVLLGDQMQLGQPIQGSHPGESGQSVLEYLLSGHRAIPEHLGIFLGTTWRLHPNLCRFISSAIYENKLHSRPSAEKRTVRIGQATLHVTKESGIVFVPLPHEGNEQDSEEEAAQIEAILEELRGRELTGLGGPRARRSTALDDGDVLVVAPYNMQVRRLRALLPGACVGTVDKFQGQEAPVVIVSMCASSGENLKRGVEFLFSPNRLNVALSRAQSLAIVVGSPELVRTRVTSVREMKLVNLFCRVVEEGSDGR